MEKEVFDASAKKHAQELELKHRMQRIQVHRAAFEAAINSARQADFVVAREQWLAEYNEWKGPAFRTKK